MEEKDMRSATSINRIGFFSAKCLTKNIKNKKTAQTRETWHYNVLYEALKESGKIENKRKSISLSWSKHVN